MDRPDVDSGDRNPADFEEVEESFERAKRTGLNTDTATVFVDEVHQTGEIGHDLFFQLVHIVIGSANEKSRASNSLLEVLTGDLDTQGSLDLLMMNVC